MGKRGWRPLVRAYHRQWGGAVVMDDFIGLFKATFAVVLGMGLGFICVIVIAKIVFGL